MTSLLFMLLLEADPSAGARQRVLEVRCPDPEGCFRLIGRAVEEAPPGAALKIGPGVYYEKPILIEKSLTLEHSEERGIVEIRFVDPQPGLSIRLTEAQRPMNVILRGLTLVTPGWSRALDERNLPAAVVIGGSPDSIESLKVVIEASEIYGYAGIGVHGAHLILKQSTVHVDAWSLNAGFGKLELLDNSLAGARLRGGFNVGLTNTEALLQNNRIWVFRSSEVTPRWAIWVGSISEWGEARAVLVENVIRGADVGAVVAGKAAVEFSGNRFVDNEDYGIMLLLPPCAVHAGEGIFEGEIRGAGNEFVENGQDLCPEDYPWPENFVKP